MDNISPNQHIQPLTAQIIKNNKTNNNELNIGNCFVSDLATKYDTPLWIVDYSTINKACQLMSSTLKTEYKGECNALFATKVWPNISILNIAKENNMMVEASTMGELMTVIEAGFEYKNIWMHGSNKSFDEIFFCIENGIKLIVDNWYELEIIQDIATKYNKQAEFLVRLVPGVESDTHKNIRTGQHDTKFGFSINDIPKLFITLKDFRNGKCIGIHSHIGSQIKSLEPYIELINVMFTFYLHGKLLGLSFKYLNLGGGLGTAYNYQDIINPPPKIQDWIKCIANNLNILVEKNQTNNNVIEYPILLVEAGRSLVASSTCTIYKVGAIKEISGVRKIVSVNGGMSDNIRPILYGSIYTSITTNKSENECTSLEEWNTEFEKINSNNLNNEKLPITIVGKHCESGDILLEDAKYRNELKSNDLIVVFTTGAYNASMSSNYNRIPRPGAVMVNNGKHSEILRRETYDELLAHDIDFEKVKNNLNL